MFAQQLLGRRSCQPPAATSRSPADAPGAPVVGSVIQLQCERLGSGGKGVCFQADSKFVVLCERALPGEQLLAEVLTVHKGYGEARKVQSLEPHHHAVQAVCPHVSACGGCTLQTLAYSAQLAEKSNHVLQTLTRVGKLQGVAELMSPALGCDVVRPTDMTSVPHTTAREPGPRGSAAPAGPLGLFEYRNKVQFTFSSRVWESGEAEAAALPQVEGTAGHPRPAGGPQAGRVVQRPALGFLRPGSFDQVLPITRCHLAPPAASAIMLAAQRAAPAHALLPANDPSGQGVLRYLVVRRGARAWRGELLAAQIASGSAGSHAPHAPEAAGAAATVVPAAAAEVEGAYLVVLVTDPLPQKRRGQLLQQLSDLAANLMRDVPGLVVGVVHQEASPDAKPGGRTALRRGRGGRVGAGGKAIRKAPSGDVEGADASPGGWQRPVRQLAGVGHLLERLCGLWLRVSPQAFFQTNTAQAEVLYRVVAQGAALRPTDTLLDLYCGTGSIGLSLAGRCRMVVGYEAVEAAVVDARFNAALNGITNVAFVCGDLHNGLAPPPGADMTDAASRWASPDVVVVNPARAGLSTAVLSFLKACGARRVVYVSCNPATQARDLGLLCNPPALHPGSGSPAFRLVAVTPVDMFPHTDHIETVAVLDRVQIP